MAKADLPLDALDELEALVRSRPILLARGHFSGEGMALLARLMNDNGLRTVLGSERADAFEKMITTDKGVSHELSPLPDQMSKSHGLGWWPSETLSEMVRAMTADPRGFARRLRDGGAGRLGEHEIHALWSAATRQCKVRGDLASFRVALELYRARRYFRWGILLVRLLLRHRRVGAATFLMRCGFDGAEQRALQMLESEMGAQQRGREANPLPI